MLVAPLTALNVKWFYIHLAQSIILVVDVDLQVFSHLYTPIAGKYSDGDRMQS